ncbi:hypothetical protein PpBr36_00622 [Pyricularia pennisetigena]|uniref:hypothetical protein n=1 Tax=Pyricularia pennisetigena TaxID=1578925 RepID=UPI00114D9ED9|nr:hypothetical protein PpBr36_00622 [Pyricularia pennisetigena]TLS29738.1 hypothetical protein PpBr36_00622 [Pyricularia pennisetigena]
MQQLIFFVAVAISTINFASALSEARNSDTDQPRVFRRVWWKTKSSQTAPNPFALNKPALTCPTWQWSAPPISPQATADGHCCFPGRDRDSLNCCRLGSTPPLHGWDEYSCSFIHWETAENYKKFYRCNTGITTFSDCRDKLRIFAQMKLLHKYMPKRPVNVKPLSLKLNTNKQASGVEVDANEPGSGHYESALQALRGPLQNSRRKPNLGYKPPPHSRLSQSPNINPQARPIV